MFGAQFAATRSPKGLKHLILSNAPASQPMWHDCLNKLVDGLPDDVRDTLRKQEEAGAFTSQEYRDAVGVFYARHLCRISPMPSELLQTFGSIGPKSNVLFTMYVFLSSIQ